MKVVKKIERRKFKRKSNGIDSTPKCWSNTYSSIREILLRFVINCSPLWVYFGFNLCMLLLPVAIAFLSFCFKCKFINFVGPCSWSRIILKRHFQMCFIPQFVSNYGQGFVTLRWRTIRKRSAHNSAMFFIYVSSLRNIFVCCQHCFTWVNNIVLQE